MIFVVIVCLFVFFLLDSLQEVDLGKLCITHPPITNQCEELALIQVIKALVGNQANLE